MNISLSTQNFSVYQTSEVFIILRFYCTCMHAGLLVSHYTFHFQCLVMPSLLSRPNWIKLYGHEYHDSCFLHVGFQTDDDLPQFGKIIDILLIMGASPLVYVHFYHTEGINSHIQSFQIVSTQEKKLFILRELKNKVVYYPHTYIGDRNMYITMRSYVLKMPWWYFFLIIPISCHNKLGFFSSDRHCVKNYRLL